MNVNKELIPLLQQISKERYKEYWQMVDRYGLERAVVGIEEDKLNAFLRQASESPIILPPEPKIIAPEISVGENPYARANRIMMIDFYKDCYNLAIDPVEPIPVNPGEFGLALYMPQNGPDMDEDICLQRKHYDIDITFYNKLEFDIPDHDRHHRDGSYWVLLRDRQEADEENKAKSAEFLWENRAAYGPEFITLPERIRLERYFFWRTGFHLDIKNITSCVGSRLSYSSIPYARQREGEFEVRCFGPGNALGYLRARSCLTGR